MFNIIDASLVTRESLERDFMLLSKSDEESAAREEAKETRPGTHMLIRCGEEECLIHAYWDEEEIAERSQLSNWGAIFKSVTSNKREYQIVNGNPIRVCYGECLQVQLKRCRNVYTSCTCLYTPLKQ